MTDPDVGTAAHSSGDPDPGVGRSEDTRSGSDVGGPAQTTESATEDAVVGGETGSAGQDDESDDQAKNPL